MKKIAVILSGCGSQDGTEITEAVSLLIALSEAKAQVECFAPHQVMIEAARITRGQMHDLQDLQAAEFDGLAFPGGFGAVLNLCNWADKGAECTVLPLVKNAIEKFYAQSKPIAAICIAPVILAKVLGSHGITLTVGDDKETIHEVQKTGAHHEVCPVTDFITDREHKIITTPAYMYNAKPHEVFKGISGLVKEFIEMA